MFCDLVGSTSLSERLDPEELRDVLSDYQAVCAKAIRRFEGHIARYFGDGLLVYFGYPHAHEDNAQRAIRAGLGIVEGMKRLNARLQQENELRLEVRVGIHTGLVVAGDMGEGGQLELMAIVGETPNIAARIQALAEPNTVVISAATHKLIVGFFDCRALGDRTLKGISYPIRVHQVLASKARSRLDVAATAGLTPLVGRDQVVGLLLERWEQSVEGTGQVVLLSGEPGIGKSRMVQMLKEHVRRGTFAKKNSRVFSDSWGEVSPIIECRCSPYHQNSALYPIIDMLQRVVLGFEREDSSDKKLSKLEDFLTSSGFSVEGYGTLFASFLSIPLSHDRYPSLKLTPQRQRQKTLEALLEIFLGRTKQHPVLLIVEDLHWADPSTLELLNLVVDRGSTPNILTLLTFRSDFSPSWLTRSNVTPITLNRLTRKQVATMVDHITKGKLLPSEVMRQIVTKTDGVPLFVEELTKMVLESGLLREREGGYELTQPLLSLAIPTTLQDSLTARLDQLGSAKEVAQLGAALGSQFSYDVLQAVSSLDEATLRRELSRLVDAELLGLQHLNHSSGTTYVFRHPLIREAAYHSLLKSTRGQYHRQIAEVLAEQFPEFAETQPGVLAHHYTEAGLNNDALVYWQRAGQRAIERSANVEAIRHATRGLELLNNLPDSHGKSKHELVLRTTLGPALIATRGYAASEVVDAYTRARELCQELGETPQLFPVLFGLWLAHLVRAELETARELGEQLLNLAEHAKDRALLLEAHRALGATLCYLGNFVASQERLEHGIALYDSQQHHSRTFFHYLADARMTCLSYSAAVLWFLGYPDQALRRIHEVLALAKAVDHPFSKSVALYFAGMVHQCRREVGAAQEQAEAVKAISTEQGFTLWASAGAIGEGWALTEQGMEDTGIAQMQQGLTDWRTTGAEILRPYFLALLAESYVKVEKLDEGLCVLTDALEAVEKRGDRFFEAELYRIKGELLLLRSEAEAKVDVEVCFRRAIEIAQRQCAKSLELRAAVSLSRLWQKQGKKVEARTLLAEIYGWFKEGFDTADLKAANVLLNELA
jgi:predicted ATPase/class 3 adenylate cyclase